MTSLPPVLGTWPDERIFRAARLMSGLVLMVFVTMHVGNLALNLISIETADAGLRWLMNPWQTTGGTILLYGSVAVHVVLVLRSLYLKRTLRMPFREAAQLVLGLLIPLLIAEHVIGTRIYGAMTGIVIDYPFVVRALWIDTPLVGLKQVVALLVIWAHGCLGMHFWLRYRDWYPVAAPYLLIGAVLLPVLGLLGFADAGRVVEGLSPAPLPEGLTRARILESLAVKDLVLYTAYVAAVAAVAATLAVRGLRQMRARRSEVSIRYESGQVVRVPKGSSVLEASRVGGIPHYSVCGGKGRCSTCRIRVIAGLDDLPSPGPVESATLGRIHADDDVRLACQLRPTADVSVLPLLMAKRERAHPIGIAPATPGREREIAVLFCDIRSFTALADRRLPYDIVFLLNRYFAIVGKAVEDSGGRLDKFIGDGAMALFGLDNAPDDACRQALAAAAAILSGLEGLSQELAGEIQSPLRVAIGIHAGPAIVGAMGYGGVMSVTAIGDTVNVASRLESAAKEFNAAVVVSDKVVELSGLDLLRYEAKEIAIRGSTLPLHVRVVPQDALSPAGFSALPIAQSAA